MSRGSSSLLLQRIKPVRELSAVARDVVCSSLISAGYRSLVCSHSDSDRPADCSVRFLLAKPEQITST